MTVEEARILIENTETNYNCGDTIYAGLTLLRVFYPNFSYVLEHEQIYVCVDFEESVGKMSKVNIEQMAVWGWSEENEYWVHGDFTGIIDPVEEYLELPEWEIKCEQL